MGSDICVQDQDKGLEIISSYDGGLEANINKYPNDAPEYKYAIKSKTIPKLTDEVLKIVMQNHGGQQQESTLEGVELPTYYIIKNDLFYLGQWNNRLPHGKGKIYFKNGSYFQGIFNRGEAECKSGLLVYSDGSFYKGEIRKSALSGEGLFVSKNELVKYKGQWQDGKPSGLGTESFSDGNTYKGSFYNGFKHGQGEFKWSDGRTYIGTFANGYMHGKGKFIKGKQIFEGDFAYNMKLNRGKVKTSEGQYEGEFTEGLFEGKGKFVWNDKKIYEGEFAKGNLHGQGVITFPNGSKIKGIWQYGNNIRVVEITSQK